MKTLSVLAAFLALSTAALVPLAAQEPPLTTALARAGAYVADFQRRLSHGRFWIEPASGRVLMSELMTENREVRATIDVSFQSEPLLGLLVPIEMRERYNGKRTGSLVEGRATNGKFRQFQVNVDEKFLVKK